METNNSQQTKPNSYNRQKNTTQTGNSSTFSNQPDMNQPMSSNSRPVLYCHLKEQLHQQKLTEAIRSNIGGVL